MRAFDLLEANAEVTRKAVTVQLEESGLTSEAAEEMAARWVTAGDFLLAPHSEQSVDFVLGNPPYIRLENVPADRNEAYRQTCPTMRGRSDVFVGFIEMGLRLLRSGGTLGFIVADRWMRNQYGTALRGFITEHFAVDAVIEMHDVDAFEDQVSAYPAITVIRRSLQSAPIVAMATAAFGAQQADDLKRWASSPTSNTLDLASVRAARLPGWFSGTDAWPSASPEQLAAIADLERRFAPLEDRGTGTRVGIGLATGADDVYLTRDSTAVERERLLPMVMAKDLAQGQISWAGHYLVNPWDDGGLIDIEEWPRFRAYLESHDDRVKARHTASKAPDRWWRTIDRMTPGLLGTPKLLLPEMKASAHPVLDDGSYYPHHNLYYVTSSGWDLEVLGGLMLSDVTNLFIGAYCVKMRGGTYRFQAQYLRRIRVPAPTGVRAADRKALASAFERRDVEAATGVAARVYGIDASLLVAERRAEVA